MLRKIQITAVSLFIILTANVQAQNVGIGTQTPNASAKLELSDANRGFLPPRVALTATNNSTTPVASPATGLLVYNTATAGSGSTAVSPGFYYYDGTQWVRVVGGATTNTLALSTNTLTSTVNGVAATSNAVSGVSNSSSTNSLTTTVNGVTGSSVNIINSNALSLSGTSVTSTVNGVASSALDLNGLDSSIYKGDGTLRSNRTVTLGAKNLTFSSTTGNLIFNPSLTGYVGIGNTSPGSMLDVKGTLRLSGSTSGYVGLQPAAAAGSTTYTLPSADGTSGQFLSTNGSGTLSWASQNSDWKLTGNSGTTAGTNFLGTTDATDLVFKTNSSEGMRLSSAGYLGIGTTSPGKALDVKMNSSGTNVVSVTNTNTAGFSSIDFMNNSGSLSTTFGFANASAGGIFSGKSYMNSYNNDFVLTRNSSEYSIFIQGSSGNIGIGNNSPGSKLDVSGTLRLEGSSSGYVGLQAASAAGSTTYTLPSADGSSGQALTTNGSGTLSWSNGPNMIQVRASSAVTVSSTSWTTVAFNTTDVANNTTALSHSTSSNTDRIIISVPGYYQVSYSSYGNTASSTNQFNYKVVYHNTGANTDTDVPGSAMSYMDSQYNMLSDNFLAYFPAAGYITFQAQAVTSSTSMTVNNLNLFVKQ